MMSHEPRNTNREWSKLLIAAAIAIAVATTSTAQVANTSPSDQPIVLPGLPGNIVVPAATPPAAPPATPPRQPLLANPGVVSSPPKAQSGSGGPLFGNAGRTSVASSAAKPGAAPMAASATQGFNPDVGQDTRPDSLPEPPAVDPTTPINPLPGLGSAPTTRDGKSQLPREAKPIIVRSQEGVTDFVYISANFPNRIATPFEKPKVIDATKTQYVTQGNSIYVTPLDSKPIAIFIVSAENPTRSIALTLVPKAIPQQNVLVVLEGAAGASGDVPRPSRERSPEVVSSDPYEAQLSALLRAIIRDTPPAGYTVEQLFLPAARMGSLRIDPVQRYSGSRYDVWRYRITNLSGEAIELQEPWFYVKGVKAIAFSREVVVGPGQGTNVFIVADQEAED